MRIFSLIPARSGSKRLSHKNIQKIGSKSLLQIAIQTSLEVASIDSTYVVTDSPKYESHALQYGAKTLGLRPPDTALDDSPDASWLNWFFSRLQDSACLTGNELYVILRPTSPFRTAQTIQSAITFFIENSSDPYTCLRAVKLVSEHPGKMWRLFGPTRMRQILPYTHGDGILWSDSQSSILPKVYVQNASLEIGTINSYFLDTDFPISGYTTIPFVMTALESMDINTELDLEFARFLYSKSLS